MVFKCTPWMDRALDLGNDWSARIEWDRLGAVYVVSAYVGDDEHTGKDKTLDGAAWALVQKLRPDPQPQDAAPQAGT